MNKTAADRISHLETMLEREIQSAAWETLAQEAKIQLDESLLITNKLLFMLESLRKDRNEAIDRAVHAETRAKELEIELKCSRGNPHEEIIGT